jgi:hypothetical protein
VISIAATTAWTAYSIANLSVPAGARVKLGIALDADAGAWTQFDDFALRRN